MSTDLQISANRLNSQKSTGPRSASGKSTSSQNACKTGIYSQAEIIRDENPADLDALAADYHADFQPVDPVERALVDILVHSEWMLRRFRRAEAQLWHINVDFDLKGDPLDPDPEHDLGFAVDRYNGHSFARLQRRIDSTQRNYQRALKDLKELQSSRPAAPPASKIEPQSETAPIGFVPSKADPAPPPPPAAAETVPEPVFRNVNSAACPPVLVPYSASTPNFPSTSQGNSIA